MITLKHNDSFFTIENLSNKVKEKHSDIIQGYHYFPEDTLLVCLHTRYYFTDYKCVACCAVYSSEIIFFGGDENYKKEIEDFLSETLSSRG